ncbi:hypothetical protein MAR_028691 [Mya arenaria]|uniref:Mutator-like transposase domain-containing protein n=1 Tax=Mya arenaria TaxID=6604 RepID=A0ABY7DEB0_MYAAR|nr:hypothetical protein MAR_028691 [Mya arenaria]
MITLLVILSLSQSGHVTIVGKSSTKCLSFGVAKTNCRFCKNVIRRKVPATKHKCGKNWTGSSKAMEPFLTLKCLHDLKRKGLEVNALTMDDDTSTYTRKCFSYTVSQNQGDPDGIKRNLTAIVPHSYGEYGGCVQKWCRAGDANYRHSDQRIRPSSATMTEKLATLSTTNPNNNMNMMISRKAPKGSHYSESESLDIRVSAAVAQKNEGHAYILKVNDAHSLSPGQITMKRCQELDKKRKFNATQHRTVKQKRCRIELKVVFCDILDNDTNLDITCSIATRPMLRVMSGAVLYAPSFASPMILSQSIQK